jgi:7-cyano-7-deazaguanine synthase
MNSQSPTSILLCSGGMDSTTLAYWLEKNDIMFIPLFINYGQHCAETEYNKLNKLLPEKFKGKIETIDLSKVYIDSNSRLIKKADLWVDSVSGADMYLPYRNLLFMSLAAAFAQSRGMNNVYAAFINSNHAHEIDCSSKFFDELYELLSNYGSVKVEMPFKTMTKYEVAKIGLELGVPIAETFSCQISSSVPCGACPNCVDRLEAFRMISEEIEGE